MKIGQSQKAIKRLQMKNRSLKKLVSDLQSSIQFLRVENKRLLILDHSKMIHHYQADGNTWLNGIYAREHASNIINNLLSIIGKDQLKEIVEAQTFGGGL